MCHAPQDYLPSVSMPGNGARQEFGLVEPHILLEKPILPAAAIVRGLLQVSETVAHHFGNLRQQKMRSSERGMSVIVIFSLSLPFHIYFVVCTQSSGYPCNRLAYWVYPNVIKEGLGFDKVPCQAPGPDSSPGSLGPFNLEHQNN